MCLEDVKIGNNFWITYKRSHWETELSSKIELLLFTATLSDTVLFHWISWNDGIASWQKVLLPCQFFFVGKYIRSWHTIYWSWYFPLINLEKIVSLSNIRLFSIENFLCKCYSYLSLDISGNCLIIFVIISCSFSLNYLNSSELWYCLHLTIFLDKRPMWYYWTKALETYIKVVWKWFLLCRILFIIKLHLLHKSVPRIKWYREFLGDRPLFTLTWKQVRKVVST